MKKLLIVLLGFIILINIMPSAPIYAGTDINLNVTSSLATSNVDYYNNTDLDIKPVLIISHYRNGILIECSLSETSIPAYSIGSLSCSLSSDFAYGDVVKSMLVDNLGTIQPLITPTSYVNIYYGNYGYLRRAKYDNNKLSLEIYSQNATCFTVFTGTSKVKVDGISVNANEVPSKLTSIVNNYTGIINCDEHEELTSDYAPMLIKYMINTSGEVNAIKTIAGDDLTMLYTDIDEDGIKDESEYTYNSSNKQFVCGDTKFTVDSSTYVFLVPNDRTNKTDYTRTNSSWFENNTTYHIEPFDVSGTMNLAKAVVVYPSPYDTAVKATSPTAFITNIKFATNPDNPDYSRLIFAYVFSPSSNGYYTVSLWAEAEAVNDLDIGDVIRYTTTSEGYIRTESVVKVLDVHDAMKLVDIKEQAGDVTYRAYNGLLYSAVGFYENGQSIQTFRIANTTDFSAIPNAQSETFTITDSAFLKYDTNREPKFSKGEIDLEAYPSYENSSPWEAPLATEIFVLTINNIVNAVYIINR